MMEKPKILIVEDELVIALNTKSILQQCGYTVTGTALTGKEALKKIEENRPGIVLVDIVLAGDIDGIALAEIIHSLDIPVIYTTAHADSGTVERVKATHPYGYILKPFRAGELHTTIEVALVKHQMEKRLKESEERYRIAIEGSNDGVAIVKGLAHVYVNRRFLDMFGYEHVEEIVGKPPYFSVHPDDLEQVKGYAVVRIQGKEVPVQYEFRGIRKDGTSIDIEVSVNTITYEGEKAILAYLRDITDRKRMEMELKKNELRYKSLIESLPDAIILHDSEKILYLNPAAVTLFGSGKVRNFVGRKILDFIHPEDRETAVCDINSAGETEDVPLLKQVRLIRDNGEIVYAECKSSTVDYGANKLFMMNMRDVTVRRRQEEQLRQYREQLEGLVEERTEELTKVNALLQQELSEHKRTEEKVQMLNKELEQRIMELKTINGELETFNYSVSHDLKTPLVAIEGFSRILMEKHGLHLDPKGRQFLGIINKNTKKMRELIEDLHSFFSVGRKTILPSAVNMEKMVNDTITDLKTILPDDVFGVECSALPPAYGDRKMIRQVLVNLFSNAIKYSKPKGIAVITVEGWIEEGKSIYSVKDKGIGFSIEYADKVFEVLERLHGPDEFEGTGIGLAIVKRIVHKHGGDVWAEGAVNEGANFYFSLPGREPVK